MRIILLGLALVAARVVTVPMASALGAQERDTTRHDPAVRQPLPPAVAREAIMLFNAAGGIRAMDRVDIEDGRTVKGDVAVLHGPLVVGGHVTGRVVAINADVILHPSARIDGDLLVVGGEVEGRSAARIGGETRVYRPRLPYTIEGERLVAAVPPGSDDGWWRRWDRRRASRNSSRFLVASAGAYNRVEGLPIQVGPQLRQVFRRSTLEVGALAIGRTASSFASESVDIGHDARLELRTRGREGVAIGGRLFDIVDAVESWQQSDLEVGLASFVLRRDYRDYFARRGGRLHAGVFARALGGDLTLAYGHEEWGGRLRRDPFTVFRNEVAWRPNPLLDAGRFHLLNATLDADTRNDENRPWSGWYIVADVERGVGDLTALGVTSPGVRAARPGRMAYTRGLLDVRRYNRLSPRSQVNLRLVTGGWLGGDELPLQRRLSVDGPGALPGFDFRGAHTGEDVATCGGPGFAPGGIPAQCERIALVQAEYRGDLHFDLFGDSEWDDLIQAGENAAWIVFFDAGRGWLVRSGGAGGGYGAAEIPSLSTFRTDAGVGLDLRLIGFYVAKALSDAHEPVNFFVRLRHRF
ncbi:MAG: hypothetical protein M3303_04405 [Gemmatimonadota bacterium]|nr:hypothetical protein [Gemmatimonadota bacterium]